jgi:hypothetical protein
MFNLSGKVRGLVGLLILAGASTLMMGQGAPPEQRQNDPELAEIRNYRLTMPKIDKYAAITDGMAGLVQAHPELEKALESTHDSNEPKNIAETVRQFETKFPQGVALIKKQGMTTREYVVLSFALLNDVMIVGMKKSGQLKAYPANSITSENNSFVEQNFDKLNKILTAATKIGNPENPDKTQKKDDDYGYR